MRFRVIAALIFTAAAVAQKTAPPAPKPDAKSVTVPVTIDHNRVVIDVDLPLPDGSITRIRAWVDNGNPDLCMSRRIATLVGLNVACGDRECSAPPPPELRIGGMKVSLAALKEAKVPLKPVNAAAVMASGMSAEINIPSTILRNYDVLVNFPGHEFSIGPPGSLKFKGVPSKMQVSAATGLIQISARIESTKTKNKNYNLALDLGASISFLADDLFDRLASAHSDWPHMTAGIGPANMWGSQDEVTWKVMRIDRLQFASLFLTNVPVVRLSAPAKDFFEKRAGVPTAGLLGDEALQNYRIGLDYAHSIVYFDIGRMFNFPDFDVIGLILRPEDDGRFSILGIADYEGKPSVPDGERGVQAGDQLVAVDGIPVTGSTMGQAWSMLGGLPGKERILTIQRGGKQFKVAATVQHFLAEKEEDDAAKEKSGKN
jgi:hypothetical protein